MAGRAAVASTDGMTEQKSPPEISEADWSTTPVAVQALVQEQARADRALGGAVGGSGRARDADLADLVPAAVV